MKFVHYCNCVSPHQLPLARELARLVGADNFRYVYAERVLSDRADMGWCDETDDWIVPANADNMCLVEDCDVLLTGVRDIDLFERRAKRDLCTFYQSERWFKPVDMGAGDMCRFGLDGRIRMVVPSFRRMAKRFVQLVKTNDCFKILPIGVHAMRDMEWLGVPNEKMMLWGYFVSPSDVRKKVKAKSERLRVLYVGRLLKLKRVDTIIQAVKMLNGVSSSLTIIGDGPEKDRLRKLAKGVDVRFQPFVPVQHVRKIMREHDVLVFASNAQDGWGAVVSEALEEGMTVLASRETGAGATLLPPERQFSCGSTTELAELLRQAAHGELPPQGIGVWSANAGASRLMKEIHE